jgi:DNA-binding transcriptional ArsR family regulator
MTQPTLPTPDFTQIMEAMHAPARREILALLDGCWMSITELARELGLAASTTSHHVHVLLRAGLVRLERQGRQAHVTARYRDVDFIIQPRGSTRPERG